MSFEEKDKLDQLHHDIALYAEQAVHMLGLILYDYFDVMNLEDKKGQYGILYEFPKHRVYCRILNDLVKRIQQTAAELPGIAVNIEDVKA